MRDEFIQLLREICDESHLEMTTFSHDWIIRIKGSHKNEANIYGYNFDVNGSASQQVLMYCSPINVSPRYAATKTQLGCVYHTLESPVSNTKRS